MPKSDSWYDRQALVSKLITYAAMLILATTIVWSAEAAYEIHKFNASINADHPISAPMSYSSAIFTALAGIATAAFLAGVSAIIDLHIVNAEALRQRNP